MKTEPYYIIKPTTYHRKKVSYGDELTLTESQARPLRHGGFITPDKAAAQRIAELVTENQSLKTEQQQKQEAKEKSERKREQPQENEQNNIEDPKSQENK